MNHDGDAAYRPEYQLGPDRIDRIADPAADGWMAGLVHSKIVGPGCEESRLRIQGPVKEDIVDGDCEEMCERYEKMGGLVDTQCDGLWFGRHGWLQVQVVWIRKRV